MRGLKVAPFFGQPGSALALLFLFAACSPNSGERIIPDGISTQKPTPMTANSPHPIDGPVNYVALGDSTGSGVGARNGGYVARLFKRIVAYRPDSKLNNLCFSGATTGDVLREQLDPGIAADPNLVTLGIGINDIGHGVSLEQFSKNYDEILSRLKEKTRAAVVVTNIPDISTAPRIPAAIRAEYHQLITQFNRKLEEIALRHGFIIFDVYTITHKQLPLHPEYFSGDGFHPSDAGYELWAEEMWPTIATTIGAGDMR
jgi:acyl-CoA thioesterase-1